MDIHQLLTQEIVPTLTDFKENQIVFWRAFDQNRDFGTPIKNVLELGVYRLPGEPHSDFPGQSTKTLMILNHFYPLDKFISLDIDDCTSTINNCKKWLHNRGITEVKNHSFVQQNSVEFKVEEHYPDGVDLIFLDTNHDDNYPEKIGYPDSGGAGMTYREICHYAKHLSRNGRMFLHDTHHYYVPKQKGWNTSGAIELFIEENSEFGFHEHDSNNHGLGEIYRLDSDVASLY